MKSSTSWILWLITVMVFLLSTRNPVYLLLVIAYLLLLGASIARKKNQTSWIKLHLRFLLSMILISVVINGLFTHTGQTVLFTLPQNWLLVGGDITLESFAYGAINGLVIGALFLLFNILNLTLQTKQLVRLIPRAFHPVAMMVTISITFFPSIQQRAQEIKEAQLIRGNPMKKFSDWMPIILPLLVTSLENAVLLSESMTARGFHTKPKTKNNLGLIGLILATFSVFTAWVLQVFAYPQITYIFLYFLGVGLILVTLYLEGKSTHHTRFHRETWHKGDFIIAIIMSGILITFATNTFTNQLPSLTYSPYPGLSFPAVEVFGLVFSSAAILPIFFRTND